MIPNTVNGRVGSESSDKVVPCKLYNKGTCRYEKETEHTDKGTTYGYYCSHCIVVTGKKYEHPRNQCLRLKMRKTRVVLVNVFNNQSVKLTSNKIIKNASEKDSINCINNSKHVRIRSFQSFNVSISYENNDQHEDQIRAECIYTAEPYVCVSNVGDTKSCIIHKMVSLKLVVYLVGLINIVTI